MLATELTILHVHACFRPPWPQRCARSSATSCRLARCATSGAAPSLQAQRRRRPPPAGAPAHTHLVCHQCQPRWQPRLPLAGGWATYMRLIRHLHATRRPCLLGVGMELRRACLLQVCCAAAQKAAARPPQKLRPWSARLARRRSLIRRAHEGEGLALLLRLIRHWHASWRLRLIRLGRGLRCGGPWRASRAAQPGAAR